MRVRVHVQGVKGSVVVEEGEEPSALFHGLLEVDGHLLEEASQVEVVFSGGNFVTVKVALSPGSFEVVTHTKESWPELLREIDAQREARAGTGHLVAVLQDDA